MLLWSKLRHWHPTKGTSVTVQSHLLTYMSFAKWNICPATVTRHNNILGVGCHKTDHIETLTRWGRVTHICVNKLTIISSDNGLSPGRRQAIIWTNAGILLFRTYGTYFSEILSKINIFPFKKMHLKISSAKLRPFCLGLNVLTHWGQPKWPPFCWRHFQMYFLECKQKNMM